MKNKLLFFFALAISAILVSCSAQYNMTGVKRIALEKPAGWQQIESQDDHSHDYVFRFQNQESWYELYLRVIYVPNKSAERWLKEEEKNSRRMGLETTRITKFKTKAYKWYMLETEDRGRMNDKKVQLSIRHYVAKEERSPRLIQCSLIGLKNSLENIPVAEVNAFIDSISLKDVKTPKDDKSPEHYTNYLTTVEEGKILVKAKDLLSLEQYSRAIEVLNSLLSRPITKKLQARTHYLLSETYLAKGVSEYLEDEDVRGFRESVESGKRALKIDPKYWQADLNIGVAYMNMSEYGQAKSYLKKALKYCPQSDPAYSDIMFHFAKAKDPRGFKRSLSGMFSHENKVGGFVYVVQDPAVMISGKPYHAGEDVGIYKILKVTQNRVYLRVGYRIDEFASGDIIPQPLIQRE